MERLYWSFLFTWDWKGKKWFGESGRRQKEWRPLEVVVTTTWMFKWFHTQILTAGVNWEAARLEAGSARHHQKEKAFLVLELPPMVRRNVQKEARLDSGHPCK